jgi:hypothetical protein
MAKTCKECVVDGIYCEQIGEARLLIEVRRKNDDPEMCILINQPIEECPLLTGMPEKLEPRAVVIFALSDGSVA